jgi:hypothetical protein
MSCDWEKKLNDTRDRPRFLHKVRRFGGTKGDLSLLYAALATLTLAGSSRLWRGSQSASGTAMKPIAEATRMADV